MTVNRGAARAACGLGIALLTFGCADPPPPAPVVAAPVTAFDGRYVGTMTVSGASTGVDPAACATDPRFVVEVANGRFQFTQTHPRVGDTTPSLRDASTMTYTATIAADGAIAGTSDSTGATMTGRVANGRMSGNVYGLLCYYSFAANRV